MENLKKLLTMCKRRGRPIFLVLTTCLALTLLTIGVTNLFSYLSTQVAGGSSEIKLKAFCYDTLDEFTFNKFFCMSAPICICSRLL